MRLQKDTSSAFHDAIHMTITVIDSPHPMTEDMREELKNTLHFFNSPDGVDNLTRYARRVARMKISGERVNPLALLMRGERGLVSPETTAEKNIDTFLRKVKGSSIVSLADGQVYMDIMEDNADKDLDRFSPEIHALAHDALEVIEFDIMEKTQSTAFSPATMIASGAFGALYECVVNDGAPELAEFPDELILEMYRDRIVAALPQQNEVVMSYLSALK